MLKRVKRSDRAGTQGSHGGHRRALAERAGCAPSQILDFSANINPLGMPLAARLALRASLHELGDYPDPDCAALCQAIAGHLGIAANRVLPGNGAEQLIWWLPRLLRAARVVVTAPCYLDYRRSAGVWGLPLVALPLTQASGFRLDPARLQALIRDGDLVWIGRPNNPTGQLEEADVLADLVNSRPGVWWAVDEAFIDFVDGVRSLATMDAPNLVVVRSMTKFYALAGLRLGYAVLPPGLVAAGRLLLPDWSVSTPAQRAGVALLTDPELARFAARSRALIRRERGALCGALRSLGATVIEGAANYLLLRLPDTAPNASVVAERLLQREHIAVRTCEDYAGLGQRHLRVAVRTAADNRRLIAGLAVALSAGAQQCLSCAPQDV
jgi:L-threonine-O-3-phosphate decarboxylase